MEENKPRARKTVTTGTKGTNETDKRERGEFSCANERKPKTRALCFEAYPLSPWLLAVLQFECRNGQCRNDYIWFLSNPRRAKKFYRGPQDRQHARPEMVPSRPTRQRTAPPSYAAHQMGPRTWFGALDRQRQPHGSGLLRDAEAQWHGQMVHGVQSGWARMDFADGSNLEGLFVDGQPDGLAAYSTADRTLLCPFSEGAMSGAAIEVDQEGQMLFCGTMLDNVRQGTGVQCVDGGGVLVGTFVDGIVRGPGVFLYPDGSMLQGLWDGDMVRAVSIPRGPALLAHCRPCIICATLSAWTAHRARHGQLATTSCRPAGPATQPCPHTVVAHVADRQPQTASVATAHYAVTIDLSAVASVVASPLLSTIKRPRGGQVFVFDDSEHACEDQLSASPLLADPFETARVCVRPSTTPGSGEGLFACRALAAGEIASFYNGCYVSQLVVDGRPWAANSNAISLTAHVALDVPAPFDQLSHYCASLGHKANHSFTAPNAKYDLCFHPRWGLIKCVRTLRPINENEEIFVDYGYSARGGPAWFRAGRQAAATLAVAL